MQVRSEEERQSGSSSGCAGRLRVHMPACSSDLSCRTSLWPSLGRLLCARVMSIEHDAFFSFYRPQVALPIKTGGEVLGVPTSIGKHRRGRPGKAGVDYQGHTGRRVQRRGARTRSKTRPAAMRECGATTGPLGCRPMMCCVWARRQAPGAERGARWPVKPKGNERKRKEKQVGRYFFRF